MDKQIDKSSAHRVSDDQLFDLLKQSPSFWVRFASRIRSAHFLNALKKSFDLGYGQGIDEPRELLIQYQDNVSLSKYGFDESIYGPDKFAVTEVLKQQMIKDTEKAIKAGLVSMPSESQWKMIFSDHPASSVVAGAGSGKSTTLVLRVVFMVCYLKIDINEIQLISFTRASCEELREKIKKVFSFEVWRDVINLKEDILDKQLKRLVRTFHSALYALSLRQYQNFDIFEFLGNRKAKDGFNPLFVSHLTDEQREIVLEAYRDCFCYVPEFRNAIVKLYKKNVLSKKLKFAEIGKNYDDKKLKMASDRDLLLTETVNKLWKEDFERIGLDIHLEPQLLKPYSGYKFYCNAIIKTATKSIPLFLSLRGTKDNEEITTENEELLEKIRTIPIALMMKKNIVLHHITTEYVHVQTLDDLEKLKFALELEDKTEIQKEAPRFEFQLEGNISKTSIEEALFSEANFIQNLGMEVPVVIKKILENKFFRQYADEYQFAIALSHFIPYLEKILKQKKMVLFNRLFLSGANHENGLPKNFQQLLNFKHLLIDEFQDISPQIVSWIKAIHRKLVSNDITPTIMAIGDDWQSIYGWRGSASELFINFHKYFPVHKDLGGKTGYYQMVHNYRSLEPILRDAEKILRPVKNKIDKEAIAVKKNDTGCMGVEVITGIDFKTNTGIQTIVARIIKEKNWVSNLANKDKNQVMILSRTRDVRDRIAGDLKRYGPLDGVKLYTYHQSKGLQADVAILCGDISYDLKHRFRNAVYKVSGIFNQTYDEAATDEIYRLAYVAATRGIRRVIWFVEESQISGASWQLRHSP
ncbi:UvrD-helicase domain-containing protein [Neisseria zalophi]|uniref:UvrD-helicase domain-containing protein n=1 Tax=Neisseria zalophi TaxID=640030 RepID=UPI00177B0AAF|nr:UvrD-helicase domain-containing protein [Neisseria zalophi]